MQVMGFGKYETEPWMSEVDGEGFKASNKSIMISLDWLNHLQVGGANISSSNITQLFFNMIFKAISMISVQIS